MDRNNEWIQSMKVTVECIANQVDEITAEYFTPEDIEFNKEMQKKGRNYMLKRESNGDSKKDIGKEPGE